MSKLDKFLGQNLWEKVAATSLLLLSTVLFVMFALHRRSGLFESSSIDVLLYINQILVWLVIAPKIVKQYKTAKAQEKARVEKEQEEAAKAGLYLSG